MLMTHIKSKEGGLDAFLEMCARLIKAVEDVETGFLMQTIHATDDPLSFRIVNLLQNDAALFAHMANPAVGEALAKIPEVSEGEMVVHLYGELGAETKAFVESLPFTCNIHARKFGFGMFAPRTLPK
eukprot:COSAG03_NODE_2400_length_2810_cov_2.950941_1_plen_127_part_00